MRFRLVLDLASNQSLDGRFLERLDVERHAFRAVSYTHLTLPTSDLV